MYPIDTTPMLEKKPSFTKYVLSDHLYEIVRRHYDSQRYGRQHMVELGWDQRYWNLANAILVSLGIRDRQQHTIWNSKGSSSHTLRYIGANLRIDPDEPAIETRSPEGAWRRLDLRECHFLT